ncbi:MAG TPA: hypothetical protein VMM76_03070 [Pirellulaceae bacterium]|nr:hypothetical protein [Pirellulaceae bacterium]
MTSHIFTGQRNVRIVAVWGLVNLCILSMTPADAQENAPSVLRFQRIAIPEGRIDEIGGELLPLDRASFQKTMADLNAKYRALYGLAKPNIVRARYTAEFKDQQLVSGSAELDIKHPHSEPAYLPLAPFGLATGSYRWKSNPSLEAEAGLLPTGDIGVFVSRSDTLTFPWSLHGTSGTDLEYRFRLLLPRATATELLLDLPPRVMPDCADAIVSLATDANTTNRGRTNLTRWRIELGANHETELRILPAFEEADRDRLVMARPTYDYRIGTTGLELNATLRLDVQRRPLRDLTLQVDPRLRLAIVQLNGNAVSFAPSPAESNQPERFILDLPTPLVVGSHELKVTAYAPVIINKLWQLPQLHLIDVLWRQGNASLDVVEPLRVGQVDWLGSVLRGVEPLPPPTAGESRRFALLSPDASFDVLLTRQTPQLRAQVGTTITLKETIVTAQFIAHLSSTSGAAFSVPLQRDAGWIVDSIETDPPQIDHVEVLPGPRGLSREIILQDPITPEKPLRLIVKAHRQTPNAGVLMGHEMRPITFAGDISRSRLTAVRAELPLQLDVSGDAGVTRVTESELSSVEMELIAAEGTPLKFRDEPSADRVRVVLRSQSPRFSGEITAETLVESTTIKQSYLFRCEPLSTRIGSVRIRFSPPPSDNIQWSTVGDGAGGVTATKLDADGNEWEVRLRRSRDVPFEILAKLTRQSTLASDGSSGPPETIVLASLPDAESQVGTVNVGTPDGTGFSLHHEGLRAIPAPAIDVARLPTLRATYRYAPAQAVSLQLTRHSTQLDPPDAWIWDSEVTSQVDGDGEVTHVMLLRIENVGVSHLTVDLPENVNLERVEVDGERIVLSRSTKQVRIPLSTTRRFPTVLLRYRQHGPPLGNHYRCVVSMPEFNLRCLHRSWRLWVPPGYKSATSDAPWDLAHTPLQPTSGIDWERRLFGLSVVRRTGKPWSVTSLLNWSDEVRQPSRRQRALTEVQNILGTIDSQLENDANGGTTTLTWSTAIAPARAANSNTVDDFSLYVDRAAISAAGISPISLVPSRATSALSALRLSNLVFVVDNGSLILTTLGAQADGDYGQCTEIAERTFIANPGELRGSSRFVLAADWIGDPTISPGPWEDGGATRSLSPLAGWTTMRLPSADAQVTVMLYRTEMLETFGWALLFVAIASGVWMGGRSGVLLLVAIVAVIVVTLLVPISLVFIPRSVLLGLLAAVALLGIRRRVSAKTTPRHRDDSMSFRAMRGAESVTAGLLLAAVIFAIVSNQRATAQERLPAGAPTATSVFRVYDPVGPDGEPFRSHLYVSPTFLDSIEKLKTTLGTQRFGVTFTDARYSLAVPNAPMATMLPELVAEFNLVSPSPGPAVIRLPFDRDELQLLEAAFDEQRVYPQWSPDGETLILDVAILNRHRLRFTFRPVLIPDADKSGFDLRIPVIPSSRLSITGRDAARIELTSALGAIIRTDDSLEANLGPADRLAVQWPVPGAESPELTEFTTSQLIWIRAEPRVITIDTRLAFSVLSGTLTEVELLVDPRLQLLLPDAHAQVVETLAPDNSLRRIRYLFREAYGANESVTIELSFVMTGVAEGDVVTRPLIRVASGVVGNPLLALSTSPGIAASVTHEGDWPSVQPQDFARAWRTMQLPKEAIQLPTNETEWSLAITPLTARLGNTDATELRVGQQQADVTYESQIQIEDAPAFQLGLALPRELIVESVSVLQDGVDLVRRYFKSPDGATTIFLATPIQGNVRVKLQGSIPLPPRGKFSFSSIRLAKAVTSVRSLTILRRAGVTVQVTSKHGSRATELTTLEHGLGSGERVVGVYELASEMDSATPDITLNITPNPARFSGSLVTKVHSEEAQWSVTADLALRVSQGVVDSIRVRLPRELTESLRLEPPLPYEIREVPEQSEPNLIITPPVAIDKEFQVTLHARLQSSSDGSISAPLIEVLDSAQVDRLLELPKRSAEQEIEWDIRGLEQPEGDELQTTYRVRGQRMRATVREVNQSAENPSLLLADIEVAWQPDASYVGIARYDLEPGALTECGLIIPEGVNLLHAAVDDVPALLQTADATTANLELGVERLPQRIALLFVGRASSLATEKNSLTLAAPRLRGLEARTTLWSVRDPRQAASVPLLNHTMIDAAATRELRVGILQELLNYNVGPVPQHRANDLQRWRERWQERLNAVTAKPADANSAYHASVVSASVVSFHDAMKRRHGTTRHDDWTYCSFNGATPMLTIIRLDRGTTDVAQRVALALALCVAAWFLLKLSRREGVRDALSRWPHLPGVVIGLAWWLWLSPSALGWLIAAVFLASSLRPAWRARVLRPVR